MISSYQRLKIKKLKAEKLADEVTEDMEFLILYPHSARAKNIRRIIKEKEDGNC